MSPNVTNLVSFIAGPGSNPLLPGSLVNLRDGGVLNLWVVLSLPQLRPRVPAFTTGPSSSIAS